MGLIITPLINRGLVQEAGAQEWNTPELIRRKKATGEALSSCVGYHVSPLSRRCHPSSGQSPLRPIQSNFRAVRAVRAWIQINLEKWQRRRLRIRIQRH